MNDNGALEHDDALRALAQLEREVEELGAAAREAHRLEEEARSLRDEVPSLSRRAERSWRLHFDLQVLHAQDAVKMWLVILVVAGALAVVLLALALTGSPWLWRS